MFIYFLHFYGVRRTEFAQQQKITSGTTEQRQKQCTTNKTKIYIFLGPEFQPFPEAISWLAGSAISSL